MILNLFLIIFAIVAVMIGFIPVLIVNTIVKLVRGENVSEYFRTIAVGIDQAGGSILYNQEKFTVSSWTWYMCSKGHKENCIFMKFINILMMSPTHCKDSFKNEIHEIKEEGEIV